MVAKSGLSLVVVGYLLSAFLSLIVFVCFDFFASSGASMLIGFVQEEQKESLPIPALPSELKGNLPGGVSSGNEQGESQNSGFLERIGADISKDEQQIEKWLEMAQAGDFYQLEMEDERLPESGGAYEEKTEVPSGVLEPDGENVPSGGNAAKFYIPFLGQPWQIQIIFALFYFFLFYQVHLFLGRFLGGRVPLEIYKPAPIGGRFSEWIIQSSPILGLVGTLVSMLLSIQEVKQQQSAYASDALLGNFINALNTTVFGALIYISNFFMVSCGNKANRRNE